MRPGTSRTYAGFGCWAVQIGFSALLAALGLFGGIFIRPGSGNGNASQCGVSAHGRSPRS